MAVKATHSLTAQLGLIDVDGCLLMAIHKAKNSYPFAGKPISLSASPRLILLFNECEDEGTEKVIRVCLNHIVGWNVISIASIEQREIRPATIQPDAILFNALLSEIADLSFAQGQTVQHFRKNPSTQFSPILLLIDIANWLSTDRMQTLGIAGAIAKPFNPVILPEQIAQILHW